MKIFPVNFVNNNSIKRVGFTSSIDNAKYKDSVSKKYAEVPATIYHQLMLANCANPKKSYTYNPVASAEPIKTLVKNYDNLDKFCELYADKINSNLMIPTEGDIENLILRIQKATGENEEKIREVLFNLTAFSGYNSFEALDSFIEKEGIGEFGLCDKRNKKPNINDFSSNSAVEYLISKKKFASKAGEKTAYILDNNSLSQLESYKNSEDIMENIIYNDFINDIKNDKVIFLNIKGWDIKTNSDGYKSANFLTGSGYLEELAVEVIKRLQQGENEDDIYYSDFKKRLFDIIDDPEAKEHIKGCNLQRYNKLGTLTNKDILELISPKAASKDRIKKIIESYVNSKSSIYPKAKVQETLLKYLDELTEVYSIDSLGLALKKLNRNIESFLRLEGYGKEEIAYLVPEYLKSFSLITAMYAQINGIEAKNINSLYEVSDRNLKKAKVILDDVSASGATEGKACYNYKINHRKNGTPLVYSPVIMCNCSENSNDRMPDSYPDEYYFDKYVFDLAAPTKSAKLAKEAYNEDIKDEEEQRLNGLAKNYKVMNTDDLKILSELLFKGYAENGISAMFPYMIPDNTSDIASLIFGELLYTENPETNKLATFLEQRKKMYPDDYECYKKVLNETTR